MRSTLIGRDGSILNGGSVPDTRRHELSGSYDSGVKMPIGMVSKIIGAFDCKECHNVITSNRVALERGPTEALVFYTSIMSDEEHIAKVHGAHCTVYCSMSCQKKALLAMTAPIDGKRRSERCAYCHHPEHIIFGTPITSRIRRQPTTVSVRGRFIMSNAEGAAVYVKARWYTCSPTCARGVCADLAKYQGMISVRCRLESTDTGRTLGPVPDIPDAGLLKVQQSAAPTAFGSPNDPPTATAAGSAPIAAPTPMAAAGCMLIGCTKPLDPAKSNKCYMCQQRFCCAAHFAEHYRIAHPETTAEDDELAALDAELAALDAADAAGAVTMSIPIAPAPAPVPAPLLDAAIVPTLARSNVLVIPDGAQVLTNELERYAVDKRQEQLKRDAAVLEQHVIAGRSWADEVEEEEAAAEKAQPSATAAPSESSAGRRATRNQKRKAAAAAAPAANAVCAWCHHGGETRICRKCHRSYHERCVPMHPCAFAE